MAASYPGAIRTSFSVKKNYVDIVNDWNVNDLQDEIVAVETSLGINPSVSTSGGSYTVTATTFASVSARIANVEAGVLGDVHTQYAKVVGGSTVTPSGTSVVGLNIKATGGQVADLQQWRDSSNNVVSRVDNAGVVYSNGAAVADNQDVQNIYVMTLFDQL